MTRISRPVSYTHLDVYKRQEQESLGLTLGKDLEQVLTAHFAAPAPAVRGGDRTLAFQVPEDVYKRQMQWYLLLLI